MGRRSILCSASLPLALLVACGPWVSRDRHRETYAAAIAEGRAAVKEAMDSTRATAVSVALVDREGLVWSEAFGTADRAAGRVATPASVFGAASVSKMLATVAVMLLVDQGKVDLEEPVVTYLPGFSMPLDRRYRDITVRMLLNHASGLPGNDIRGAITVEPFPGYAAQVLEGLKGQRLKHDPGLIASYNNDGFTMAQNLVAAVSGQAYPDFVRQRILQPLGMTSSQYLDAPLALERCARPYSGDTAQTIYAYNVYATGGLFTTAEDLARLAGLFLGRGQVGGQRILSARAVDAMAQDQRVATFNPLPYEEMRFGLGWDTVAQPGLAAVGIKAWQKTGDASGYYGANLMVLPEEGLGAVVMGASNGWSSANAFTVCERILLRALVARGRLAALPAQLPAADLATRAVGAEEKAFAGCYASGSGAYRLAFGSGDTLTLSELHEDWVAKYKDFKLRTDGWWAADGDPHTALRLLSRGGHDYFGLRLKRGCGHYTIATLMGQRLDPRAPVSEAWQGRLGERWLPFNTDPWFNLMIRGDCTFTLRKLNGLEGYLLSNKVLRDTTPPSDRLDAMFLTAPDAVRDLTEAALEPGNLLRSGSTLYRALSDVPRLAPGSSTLAIGSEGHAEWRTLPASGTLTLSGAGHWFLFDADFAELAWGTTGGTARLTGSGDKHLLVYGPRGARIALTLTVP